MLYYELYYKCNKMPEGAKLYKESCAIATDMTKNMNPTASAIHVSLGVCSMLPFYESDCKCNGNSTKKQN